MLPVRLDSSPLPGTCSPAGQRLATVAALILLAALAGGCASNPQPYFGNLHSETASVRSCAAWLQAVDGETDRSGVRDAGEHRIPGFPYLRIDRFLASFRADIGANDEKFRTWWAHLRRLDAVARAFEARNLADPSVRELGAADARGLTARNEACSAELARADLENPRTRELLEERAGVPDDYTDWQRIVGLYALTRIPFGSGIERWHAETRRSFRQAREESGSARLVQRFVPPSAPLTDTEIADILRRSVPDALGIPRLAAADRDRLLAAYAPVFEIETRGASDRFGNLAWGPSATPEVDTTRPTVFQRVAYTRFGPRTLLQLVYTIWFPERPLEHTFDLLGGKLDGVVVRVTLAPDGTPLVYDSIHPCGCYHMFFPTSLARPRAAPDPSEEWAFIPVELPRMFPGQRILLRVAAITHYLIDIRPDAGEGGSSAYAAADDDSLRSLPVGDGTRRSIFGPDGLVAGTERAERYFFWPMGIPSAGAMRQWGTHATAFVGRRHFDDADLIERRFAIELR